MPLIQNLTSEESDIYKEIKFLKESDGSGEVLGCYYRGHCDIYLFTKVAAAFMEHECSIRISSKNRVKIKKGYFKFTPLDDGVLIFKESKVRGSYPVMILELI